MKTKAVRMYGAMDLRIEEFELPALQKDEVLLQIVSDSLCTSTYKAVKQGAAHKRVPDNIADHPVIIGHEMCGIVKEVGEACKDLWQIGQKVVIQPALKLENFYDPGYSYPYIGGSATYVVVPSVVLERNCMIPYNGDGFFNGSLVEALGCILRGFKGLYHTDYETYERTDGAKKNGKIAILGGAGPMGIGAVELAIGYAGAKKVVVTDINQDRLDFAEKQVPVSAAKEKGCTLTYLNTANTPDAAKTLLDLSDGGFDDVFVMVPVPALFTLAERICGEDGCINFFAGPPVHSLDGALNLYRVHYDGIHVVGTAGSIPRDTVDTIRLLEANAVNAGAMVSHILGLNAVPDAIYAMEKPSGAKKVCYTHLDIPMIAIDELEKWGERDPMYRELDRIVKEHGGIWCSEAEEYLLEHAKHI